MQMCMREGAAGGLSGPGPYRKLGTGLLTPGDLQGPRAQSTKDDWGAGVHFSRADQLGVGGPSALRLGIEFSKPTWLKSFGHKGT